MEFITLTLPVTGMSCAGCANTVTRVLTNQPGVAQAQVDLAAQQARIEFDPALTNREQLAAAVRAAGFGVEN